MFRMNFLFKGFFIGVLKNIKDYSRTAIKIKYIPGIPESLRIMVGGLGPMPLDESY